jgi:DNA-binding response OmpR family regulator
MSTDAEIIRDLRMRVALLEVELNKVNEEEVQASQVFAGILTKLEFILLLGIARKEVAQWSYLDNITEQNGKYDRYSGEMHQTLRTKVAVWKMRRKLKPLGIEIKTWRGIGYYLDDENKAKLRQLMEKKDALV